MSYYRLDLKPLLHIGNNWVKLYYTSLFL